jgi:hypothetical protein
MRLRQDIPIVRRFLSVVLTYALVLAGVVGVEAHAHHASAVHQHTHSLADAAHVASDDATSGHEHAHRDGKAPATHHCGDCLDFVCHGGLAVLPTIDDLSLPPASAILTALTEFALVGRRPAPLDRPPLPIRS